MLRRKPRVLRLGIGGFFRDFCDFRERKSGLLIEDTEYSEENTESFD
jgi:hypothetical protein